MRGNSKFGFTANYNFPYMHITHSATVAELNQMAADIIISELNKKSQNLFCTATGNSPTGIYKLLAERKNDINTKGLSLLKLDEWYGLPMDHLASCVFYHVLFLFCLFGV